MVFSLIHVELNPPIYSCTTMLSFLYALVTFFDDGTCFEKQKVAATVFGRKCQLFPAEEALLSD